MKSALLSVAIIFINFLYGQQNDSMQTFRADYPHYPDGQYKTMKEFLSKNPTGVRKMTPKGVYGIKKPVLKEAEHFCNFAYADNDKRIRNQFAVVHNGNIYFQVEAILDYVEISDVSQNSHAKNSFVRVLFGGENYLYTEIALFNNLANFAMSVGGTAAAGGMGAGLAAGSTSAITYGKGAIFDMAGRKFNIFKNCKDFNSFIKKKLPSAVQECKRHDPDMMALRRAIAEIQ